MNEKQLSKHFKELKTQKIECNYCGVTLKPHKKAYNRARRRYNNNLARYLYEYNYSDKSFF